MSHTYLDLTNTLFGDTQVKESYVWAGGEVHISVRRTTIVDEEVSIITRLNSSDDIMRLFLARDLFPKDVKVNAVFPYVPYARQDRVCHHGEPFSLKTFASLVNSRGFNKVRFFDAHSNVSELLIENSENVSNRQFVTDALDILRIRAFLSNEPVIVAPDAGSYKKAQGVSDHLKLGLLPCHKQRATDGSISETTILGDVSPDKEYVIVDDICDGGRTFIELATALRAKGATKVHLVVSHGIFSQGFGPLLDVVDTISTTSSIQNWFDIGLERVICHSFLSYMGIYRSSASSI